MHVCVSNFPMYAFSIFRCNMTYMPVVFISKCRAIPISPHFALWLPCRLHGINQLLLLVRSRYKGTPLPQQPRSPATPRQKPTMSFHPASLHSSSSPMFSLSELQEDVVTTFLAGKPQILDPSSLRTPFKFRLTAPSKSLHPAE